MNNPDEKVQNNQCNDIEDESKMEVLGKRPAYEPERIIPTRPYLQSSQMNSRKNRKEIKYTKKPRYTCPILKKPFNIKDTYVQDPEFYEDKPLDLSIKKSSLGIMRRFTPVKITPESGTIVCYRCCIGFSTHKELSKHMSTHEMTCINSRYKSKKYKSFNNHFCTVCNVGFLTPGQMSKHMAIHQKPYKNLDSYGETSKSCKNFTCYVCKVGFSSRGELLEHMAIHSDKISVSGQKKSMFGKNSYCYICGDKFFRCDVLVKHIDDIHNKPKKQCLKLEEDKDKPRKNLFCDICGDRLLNDDELIRHMSDIHYIYYNKILKYEEINFKPCKNYVCYICNKAYFTCYEMVQHVVGIHNISHKK